MKNLFLLFLSIFRKYIIYFIFFLGINILIVFGNFIDIPDIDIEVQSGLNKVGNNIYECKQTDCIVNLNIENIFTGSFDKNNFDCEWDFGYGTFTTANTDKKCNPGYVNYGIGEFDLSVKVIEKNNLSNFKQIFFKIFNISKLLDNSGIGIENNSITDTGTGIIDIGTGTIDIGTGTIDTGTGIIDIGTGSINTGVILIPEEIIWNFQIPSYVLNKDTILEKYICDSSKDICKINLDLSNSFTGSLKESDFLCENDFGFLTGEENKCNPNTIEVPKGEFVFNFKIISKEDNNIFIEKGFVVDNNIIDTGTGTIDSGINNINTGTTNTGIIDTGTGTIDTGTGIIDIGIISIPKNIIWNFQSPSYILNKDTILEKYICDSDNDICKINLDLGNSFEGVFKESNFLCKLDFGFGFLTGEENKCNPNTIEIPKGEFSFNFKIISKQDEKNFSTGGFIVENNILVKTSNTSIGIQNNNSEIELINNNIENNSQDLILNNFEKQNIVLGKILVQSGLSKSSENTYFCNKEICSINLNYENDNKNILCEWNFGNGTFETENTDKKCNPGYVKFPVGNHKIKLKIYDKNYINNFKETFLDFKNIYGTIIEEKIIELDEELLVEDIIFDFSKLNNLKLGNISANPAGVDTLEYIEIINTNKNVVNLKGCYLDDILTGGSKKYIFEKDTLLFPNTTKKFYKSETKLNLNNTGDEVNLICGNNKIDNISWNFSIASGYLINHDKDEINSQKVSVLKVIDGDTLVIKFNNQIEKLRLIGVDTPEIKDPRKPVQFFGYQASNFTKEQLTGKEVFLEIDLDNYRDKYSRLLGYIYVDGESFNKKLVEEGYARVYDKFEFKYLNEYKKAEKSAKENKKGMWKFINSDLEKKLFEKYNTEIKDDEDYLLLEEKLNEKLEEIKIEEEILKENENKYFELSEEIDLLYLSYLQVSKDINFNNIPDEFEEYKKANLLEINIFNKFIKNIKNELISGKILNENNLSKNIINYLNDFSKKEIGKYKLIENNLYIIDEQKSIENYSEFIKMGYKISISKLKSGLKIYGNTLSNSQIKLEIYEDKFFHNSIFNSFSYLRERGTEKYNLKTDENGYFELIIDDIEKINYGDFYIKSEITDNNENVFLINQEKEFNVSIDYVLDYKQSFLEKQYKDELQTFSYLEKNLVSLEKGFNSIIKKILKEKAKEKKKKQKKKKKKKIKKAKVKKEKILKNEVFNKKENFINDNENKYGILYVFLILIFGFSLTFILLKREKII